MKNTKRFKDFKNWDRGIPDSRVSTEELVKMLKRLIWSDPYKGIKVKFFDTTKKDLISLEVNHKQDFFEIFGELSPEEIQFINVYTEGCYIEIKHCDHEYDDKVWFCSNYSIIWEDKILLEEDS